MKRRFLYFIPGVKKVDAEIIEKAGLARSIGGLRYVARECASGPCGMPGGVTFMAHEPGENPDECMPGYHPKDQTWHKFKGGAYCIGYANDAIPRESDLRHAAHHGHGVPLLNGQTWHVPAVRVYEGTGPIPRAIGVGENGELIVSTIPQFKDIEDGAWEFWSFLIGEMQSFDYVRAIEIAEQSMSLNYRIGSGESTVLGLFSTKNVFDCARAIVDWPTLEAESKKNGAAQPVETSSTECGQTGETTNTDQPSQS